MAIEDNTIVIKVPAQPFLEFMKNNTDICFKLLSSLAKRLRFLNSHIESVTLDDVSKRLVKYLLIEMENPQKEKNKFKNESFIELEISKYDLASHLGTITQTLSRALKKLQENNIIEVKGKKIVIKDFTALKNSSK
jgi:CRP/FNR family transcriptional regulator